MVHEIVIRAFMRELHFVSCFLAVSFISLLLVRSEVRR